MFEMFQNSDIIEIKSACFTKTSEIVSVAESFLTMNYHTYHKVAFTRNSEVKSYVHLKCFQCYKDSSE